MGKIKGWERIYEGEDILNMAWLNMSRNEMVTVNRNTLTPPYNLKWDVSTVPIIQTGKAIYPHGKVRQIGRRETKKEAIKLAMDYMRRHPNG